MFTKNLAILLAVSGAYASPVLRRDECSDKCSAEYNACRSAPGANMSTCAANFSSCLGYLPFDDQGSLVTPTACSSTAAATPTADACAQKCQASFNSCRTAPDANMSYCASQFAGCLGYSPWGNGGSYVPPTACAPAAAPAAARVQAAAVEAEAESWTVKSLTRQCSEDRTGCNYNFGVSTNDGQADTTCNFARNGVQNAPEESFYNVPCSADSPYMISWGYSTQFEVPFAVMTVVDTKKNAQAYFGVNNPAAATSFGDVGPEPVYYN